EGRQSTVTLPSPGTRKNSGEMGENGSRNLLSKMDWATCALPSSEFGTVTTESCNRSRVPGLKPRHPIAESIASTPGASGVAFWTSSGFGVIVTGHGIDGHLPVISGAAKMYATTIVAWPPGGSVSGPLDWNVRVSDGWLLMKQRCVMAGSPVLHCG